MPVLIFGRQKFERGVLRKEHHQILGSLHRYAHNLAKNVMGDFDRVSLDVRVGLKLRYGGLENWLNNRCKRIPGALVFIELIGAVGRIVVPSDSEHGVPVELIETDRALVGGLLLLFVEIQLATQVKRIGKTGVVDRRANRLQIVHVLELERPHLRIFDLHRRHHLRGRHSRREQNAGQLQPRALTIFGHKPFRALDKEGRRSYGCTRSKPASPFC